MLKYSGLYNIITAAVRFNKIFIKKNVVYIQCDLEFQSYLKIKYFFKLV